MSCAWNNSSRRKAIRKGEKVALEQFTWKKRPSNENTSCAVKYFICWKAIRKREKIALELFQVDFFPSGGLFSTDEMFHGATNSFWGSFFYAMNYSRRAMNLPFENCFPPPCIVPGRLFPLCGSLFFRWNVSQHHKFLWAVVFLHMNCSSCRKTIPKSLNGIRGAGKHFIFEKRSANEYFWPCKNTV